VAQPHRTARCASGGSRSSDRGPPLCWQIFAPRETLAALRTGQLWDVLGIRLNGPKAEGKHIVLNWRFSDTGETFVLKAGRTFALSHVNQLGEPVLASPALVDGRWYFRTASSLLAIGAVPRP